MAMQTMQRFFLINVLAFTFSGCGFVISSKNDDSETEESSDKKTIKSLDENGLALEAYNASLWGFIVNANSLKSQTSAVIPPSEQGSPAPSQATAEPSQPETSAASSDPGSAPVQNEPVPTQLLLAEDIVESIDDSLIDEDDQTIYQAPDEGYRYLAVRKCLRLETVVEDGLTAEGIYCLRVESPDGQFCRFPKQLIRGPTVRKNLNSITDDNLDLANVLVGKLGFTYDATNRKWSKSSDGIVIKISPLRVAALSLEEPCSIYGGDDGIADGGGVDGGGVDGDGDDQLNKFSARIDMSSRLAIPRKIAVDTQNRVVIAASSAGTATVYSMLVGRFLPDNTPDPSFGSNGFTELTNLPGVSAGYTVKIDEQRNHIFVSGYQNNEFERIIVALTMDGQLDKSWGSDGVVVINGMNINFEIDADGRIYTLTNSVLQRFDAKGVSDVTFGTDGKMTFDTLQSDMYHVDFAVVGEKLYVLGEIGDRSKFGLFTLNLADAKSKLAIVDGISGDDMQSLRLAVGGERVMAFGRKISGSGGDGFFVSAFLMDGSLDASFASGGTLRAEEGSSQEGLVFDSPDTFWMSGWNGLRRYNMKGEEISKVDSNYYFAADWLVMGVDGSLIGASVAHGGGDLFRLPKELLSN